MSISPENNQNQGIDIGKSPADYIQEVETEEATYAVYKLGEETTGYSDFPKGEVIGPEDGKKLLNFETNKEKYSLRPEYEGKAMEVYQPEDTNYNLVIQRIDNSSTQQVPEEDKRKIRQTLESLK